MMLLAFLIISIWLICRIDAVEPANKDEKKFTGLFPPKYVLDMYRSGLHRLTRNAKTEDCKKHIEFEYMKYMRSISEERPFPFEDVFFHSQCENHWKQHKPIMAVGMKKPPPKPKNLPVPMPNNVTQKDPADIAILYVLLMHNHPSFAQRLLLALDEPQHTFVVHVDKKASSNDAYESMLAFATENKMQGKLRIMTENRQSGNWGGFSLVNSTLNAMRTAMEDSSVKFDYMIDISGTTYPLVDNQVIRTELAKYPGMAYMDVHKLPSRPSADMWLSYVECDEQLHRIGRLAVARGINMYVGSQWFAIPYHVAHWFLNNPLPIDYSVYAKRVVVADENYFGTMFKNSPYCEDLVQKNHVFVLFDKWENERNVTEGRARDPRKCLHPDPNHCGRSPTTLTMEYKRILQASQHLFARKFDPDNEDSMLLLDEVDRWRQDPQHRLEGAAQKFMIRTFKEFEDTTDATTSTTTVTTNTRDAGHHNDTCLEISKTGGEQLHVVACDANNPAQWFTFGRCTGSQKKNGLINLSDKHCGMFLNTNGNSDTTSDISTDYSGNNSLVAEDDDDATACQLLNTIEDNENKNSNIAQTICMDIVGESHHVGAGLIGWECTGNWNQLFHYADDCTLSAVQPNVIAEARNLPKDVKRCLAQVENGVQTSDCPGEENESVSSNTDEDQGAAKDEKDSNIALAPAPNQQWQMLTKDGTIWKQYWSDEGEVDNDYIDEEL